MSFCIKVFITEVFMEEKYLLLNEKSRINIKEYMPNENALLKLAEYFQNFSDSTRLKIISCLSMADMCVNDMSIILNVNQTTISHQLKILKAQNIVEFKRDGKILTYTLKNKTINDVMLNAVNWIS